MKTTQENVWHNPAEAFMRRLKEQRIIQLIKNTKYLQSLRYDWAGICSLQKTFEMQLEQRNTSISQLVVEACQNLTAGKESEEKHNGKTKVV